MDCLLSFVFHFEIWAELKSPSKYSMKMLKLKQLKKCLLETSKKLSVLDFEYSRCYWLWCNGPHRTFPSQHSVNCLTAPSHYLNQCWLIISKSSNIYLRAISQETPLLPITKISFKLLPGVNELNNNIKPNLLICKHLQHTKSRKSMRKFNSLWPISATSCYGTWLTLV